MKQFFGHAGLSAGALKLYAILAMLLDHVAWAFVPTASPLGQILHIIGRTTIPIMCFFIAEGYARTRSVSRYAWRLALFAAASYLPYIFFKTGGLPQGSFFFYFNVIYTLLCCLLSLWVWEQVQNQGLKVIFLLLLLLLSDLGDWGGYAVLFTLSFGLNRGNFPRQAAGFSLSALVMFFLMITETLAANSSLLLGEAISRNAMQLGVLLALPLLALYNGKKGRGGKWTFYLFYPLHLAALGLLQMLIDT